MLSLVYIAFFRKNCIFFFHMFFYKWWLHRLFCLDNLLTWMCSHVYMQADLQCLHFWDLLFSTMLLGRVPLTTSSSIWLTHGITLSSRPCKDCRWPWPHCMYVVWCTLLMPNPDQDMIVDCIISVGSFWVFSSGYCSLYHFCFNVKSGTLPSNIWFTLTSQMTWERLFSLSQGGRNYCYCGMKFTKLLSQLKWLH